MILAFILGATNAGKSTFLQESVRNFGDAVGTVEVGKMLRAKYPPEYFKGSAAPDHTEVEAWALMHYGIAQARADFRRAVLIDGQPRSLKQARRVYDELRDSRDRLVFLHLWCDAETRRARAESRDGADAAKLDLSRQRVTNDAIQLYEVLSFLSARDMEIMHVDTARPGALAHVWMRHLLGPVPLSGGAR